MHPEDAAKTISEIDYDIHCLLIYTDLSMLREFYSRYIPEQIQIQRRNYSNQPIL